MGENKGKNSLPLAPSPETKGKDIRSSRAGRVPPRPLPLPLHFPNFYASLHMLLLWEPSSGIEAPYPGIPRNNKLASVDFSFHSHSTAGALGCFYPHAFPMSFESHVICGRQALHSVKRS